MSLEVVIYVDVVTKVRRITDKALRHFYGWIIVSLGVTTCHITTCTTDLPHDCHGNKCKNAEHSSNDYQRLFAYDGAGS